MADASFYIIQQKLTNFKNCQSEMVQFSPKLNFIVGNNGIGKTNLLDAIYYTCLTKSYFTTDFMLPNFSNTYFRIETHLMLNSDNQTVEIKYLKQEKKEVFINKVKMEKQAEYIGRFPCVIITPDDNQLILGASELRRKFIDATLCQFSTEYLNHLVLYTKILTQRNALLKSFFERKYFDKILLESYNQKLIASGSFIFTQRKLFVEKLIPIVEHIYSIISGGKETISIAYHSDLIDTNFEQLIQQQEEHDKNALRTTKGVHTDDLSFKLNDFPVKKIGSQGQQKTFLIALKLAQYELLRQEKHLYPLLLLDDIFDKLDTQRMERIFRFIHDDNFGQVFITDTNAASIQAIIDKNDISQYKIIPIGKL
ncbi:MAG: DNA replication and repair protein RecF [Chitinophagales bacterium]